MLPLRPLHPITTLTLLLSLSLFCFRLTSAVCCTSKDNGYCYDNNRMKGYCCGHGSCNLFCCACSGGESSSSPSPALQTSCCIPRHAYLTPELRLTLTKSTGCLGGPVIPTPPRARALANLDGRDVTTDSEINTSSTENSNNMILSQYAVCHASTGPSIFSGDEDCGSQLFHLLDTEGAGKISLAQYLGWHALRGYAADTDDEFMLGAAEYFHRYVPTVSGWSERRVDADYLVLGSMRIRMGSWMRWR